MQSRIDGLLLLLLLSLSLSLPLSLSLSLSSVCLYISLFVIYLIVSQPWYMRFDQGETAADGCSAVFPWGPRYLCLQRMLCAKFGWNLPLVLQKYGRF